ncbi:MAG TPA: threonine synthase [Nitrososphaerales archaeon]|nr:threonine synthase [Nitrososphaerales archaeon]
MTTSSGDKKRDHFSLQCFSCKTEYKIDDYGKFYHCQKCGDLLEVVLRPGAGKLSFSDKLPGIWKYMDVLPLWNSANIVSLSEGGTPLLECRNLGRKLGLDALYVKFEGLNPTGSFKDRGMTVGISKAKELGYERTMCASTGNTSASLAAYAAKAQMRCIVLVPKGKIAMGKMAQAIAYGAEIFQVDGNFDDSLRVASDICERDNATLLLNSLNPFRIEGQKTVSFEIVEQLGGGVPDALVLPVGNGGNISAAWKGFTELFHGGLGNLFGIDDHRSEGPRMIGVQAAGAAPIAKAFKEGIEDAIEPVSEPHTEASAINIGSPVSWRKVLSAIYSSKGLADSVTDEEIFSAQQLLASSEGLFVEPASATPIAFLVKSAGQRSEEFERLKDKVVVCICTGNGLKDPNALLKTIRPDQIQTISADARSLETVLA